jgi:hypothetical protein
MLGFGFLPMKITRNCSQRSLDFVRSPEKTRWSPIMTSLAFGAVVR